jgi:hypothetical protein
LEVLFLNSQHSYELFSKGGKSNPKQICAISLNVQLFTRTFKISQFNYMCFPSCMPAIFELCGHH